MSLLENANENESVEQEEEQEESSFENPTEDSQDTTFEEESHSEDSEFVLDEDTPAIEPIEESLLLKPVGVDVQENRTIPDFLQAKRVDLDRKLPLRFKKPEFEPKENGILLNISQPILSHHYDGHPKLGKSRIWTDFIDFNHDSPPQIELKLIPFYSDWFQWRQVHEMETWAFPLFCGIEASEINRNVYIHIRDSMIEAYNSQPCSYLSITECYTNLCYDVNDIISIHQFLERYKLINERVRVFL